VGKVEEEKLKEVTEKTEQLIERKIRTLVLNQDEFLKLKDRLEIKNALFIWGKVMRDE